MALIDSATLTGVADRCAYQYGMLSANFDLVNITGGGFYWQRVIVTDDPDVEIPLLSPYLTVDTTGFDLATMIRTGVPGLLTIVTTMDTHFRRVGLTTSWDGYLSGISARVSDYFNQVYYLAKNSYMLANNVFSESEDIFATWTYAGGYTAGINYGTGSALNKADGTAFAPTQLKAIVDVGSTTCTNLILHLTVKDWQNLPVTIDTPAITGGAGTTVNIGTTSDRFLAVTAISVTSGDLVGNAVRIENRKERQVAP